MMPPEIRVEADYQSARYTLPLRPLGKIRWVGLLLVVFGLFFVGGPAGMFRDSLKSAFSAHGGFHWFFVAFIIPFIVAGLIPIGLGLAVLCGHAQIEWRDGKLNSYEVVGPFRWRRRIAGKGDVIRRLMTGAGTSRTNNGPAKPMPNFAILVAEFENKDKPKVVVMGYPKDWLLGLAEHLSSRIGATPSSAGTPRVEVVEASDTPELDDVPAQPPGSSVTIERGVGRLKITVPPVGIWKGARFMILFAMLWCGFMTVFTGGVIFGTSDSPESKVPVFGFLLLFWCIGIALAAIAVNMGKRHASIEADGDRLMVVLGGPFGTKSLEFRRSALAAIRADNSGMEVNDQPVPELQIHPIGAKKIGVLAGRDREELRWIATELRQALKLPAKN